MRAKPKGAKFRNLTELDLDGIEELARANERRVPIDNWEADKG